MHYKQDGVSHINVDYFECLTGDIPGECADQTEEIGRRVKTLRNEKGLSIEELSNMTGFDVELLDKIEKNEIQPQLGTIMKLSKALDGAFSRLISGRGTNLYSICRKKEAKVVSRAAARKGKTAYVYKSLAPEVKGRHMESLVVQLASVPDMGMSVHSGEEFIYVLDGVVQLTIDKKTFDLDPGDSAYYLSTTPHLITAKDEKATILAVIYDG